MFSGRLLGGDVDDAVVDGVRPHRVPSGEAAAVLQPGAAEILGAEDSVAGLGF